MQCYNIAFLKQRVKVGKAGLSVFPDGSCIHKNIHTETLRRLFNRFADTAIADNAKGFTGNLVGKEDERGEDRRFFPATLFDKFVIFGYGGVVHKNIANNLLGHRIGRVAAGVADRNSFLLSVINVNIIVAGREKTYIFKLFRRVKNFFVNYGFVAEDYISVRCFL